jgi:hypothetical protein
LNKDCLTFQVGIHGAQISGTVNLKSIGVLFHQRPDGTDNIFDPPGNTKRFQEKIHFAGFDLGQVENIVDKAQDKISL